MGLLRPHLLELLSARWAGTGGKEGVGLLRPHLELLSAGWVGGGWATEATPGVAVCKVGGEWGEGLLRPHLLELLSARWAGTGRREGEGLLRPHLELLSVSWVGTEGR